MEISGRTSMLWPPRSLPTRCAKARRRDFSTITGPLTTTPRLSSAADISSVYSSPVCLTAIPSTPCRMGEEGGMVFQLLRSRMRSLRSSESLRTLPTPGSSAHSKSVQPTQLVSRQCTPSPSTDSSPSLPTITKSTSLAKASFPILASSSPRAIRIASTLLIAPSATRTRLAQSPVPCASEMPTLASATWTTAVEGTSAGSTASSSPTLPPTV
mmetsp:Transcript_18083/g.42735  ORF Transcript_18083/g.42735 Transcript_18083/m.42735 type:complete len:213 (+) Transcript_18083:1044-1682(+)